MGHVISKVQHDADAVSTHVASKTSIDGSQLCNSSGQETKEGHDSDEHKHSDRLQAACIVEEMATLRHKSVELLHNDMEKLYANIEGLHGQLNHCATQIAQQDETLSGLIAHAHSLQGVIEAYALGYQPQPVNETKPEHIDGEQISRTATKSPLADSGVLPDRALLERLCAVEKAVAAIQSMVEGLTQQERTADRTSHQSNAEDPSQTVLAPRSSSAPVEQSLPQDWDDLFNPDEAITTSPPHHTSPPQMQLQHEQPLKDELTTVPGPLVADVPSSVVKPRRSLFGEHNLTRKPQQESGHDNEPEVRSLLLKRKAADELGPARLTKGFTTIITSDCALASGMLEASRKIPPTAKAIARRSGREHKPNPLRVRPTDTQINTSDSIAELAVPDSCQLDYGAFYGIGRR